MTNKSIIIIGAGLAGLATGCYGQMNGYKTKIFEKQTKSGGVCVSWKRKGYTFDYAIHNLFGTATNSAGNQIWRELSAFRDLKTQSFSEFVQIEDTDGRRLTVYTNLDKLERHMMTLSPEDNKIISEFIKACRRFGDYSVLYAMPDGFGAMIRLLPILGSLIKYSKITIKEFAKKFRDPFLQKAFASIQYDIPYAPAVIPMMFLAELNKGDGGWPLGGSSAISKNVERRYLDLGGQIIYHARVVKIIVDNDRAIGIELEDGSQHFGDIVVSAADGYSTIFGMLRGSYISELARSYYNSYPETVPFGCEVCYGVNRDLSDEPHALVLFLDNPLIIEGKGHDRLDIEIFNFDPSLAPPGKTVVKVVLESNYDYWRKLSNDTEVYKNEKTRIADVITERLEKRFPGFRSQVEAVDVVTPVSVEHFTASYRGALPWPAPNDIAKEVAKNGISRTLPGLDGFFMVGQWAGAQYSTTGVATMGRDLVRELCKYDRKEFVTTTAEL